ncbi:MAG: hypothetical protein IRZ16_19280 [Myxococcaceae bacterium]|nr:hypothetical protein [Myxococcaceae bacterium]
MSDLKGEIRHLAALSDVARTLERFAGQLDDAPLDPHDLAAALAPLGRTAPLAHPAEPAETAGSDSGIASTGTVLPATPPLEGVREDPAPPTIEDEVALLEDEVREGAGYLDVIPRNKRTAQIAIWAVRTRLLQDQLEMEGDEDVDLPHLRPTHPGCARGGDELGGCFVPEVQRGLARLPGVARRADGRPTGGSVG